MSRSSGKRAVMFARHQAGAGRDWEGGALPVGWRENMGGQARRRGSSVSEEEIEQEQRLLLARCSAAQLGS